MKSACSGRAEREQARREVRLPVARCPRCECSLLEQVRAENVPDEGQVEEVGEAEGEDARDGLHRGMRDHPAVEEEEGASAEVGVPHVRPDGLHVAIDRVAVAFGGHVGLS